jgi:tRNA-splicing ligase RtcB
MSEPHLAPLATWPVEPLAADVAASIDRLRRAEDVRYVALMPDVHLASQVCVGAVVATSALIYPAAVGGDIGCGMAAVRLDAEADLLRNERAAAQLLAGLYEAVPANRQRRPRDLPEAVLELPLCDSRLERLARRDGRVQFGTLGRGNHFLEFQADEDDALWVVVHSGSRAMGQAIAGAWLKATDERRPAPIIGLDAISSAGAAYLANAAWARAYARESRLAMLQSATELAGRLFAVCVDWSTLIHGDHNHVAREEHFGAPLWVHRKGAQSAADGVAGIVPGSMGTATYHVVGRGCLESLASCAHGAGRRLSRGAARSAISSRQLHADMTDVWYDHRRTDALRDEAPSAYKDVRQVMRAQRPLVRIVRELRPVLVYKGT